jgi:lysophospholipase L1-like esterase
MALPSARAWLASLALVCLAPSPSPAKVNLAAIPQPRFQVDWLVHHQQQVILTATRRPPVYFLGDSITAGWGGPGAATPFRWGEFLFQSLFRPAGAVNFGIPGDCTQHVLWRVQNGLFLFHQPKVVVLMIGTNNLLLGNTPEEVAQGIAFIVRSIQVLSPGTRVLLLGVLPAEVAGLATRHKAAVVNRLVAGLHDGQSVVFLNMARLFLSPNGRVNRALLYDGVHPSFLGYYVWAQVIVGPLRYLLALP